ncbi:hypothetical protein ACP4I1_36845 [Streptomyces sp. WG4]|uniref:hypothetical protein n=1 Tax=Streptomyces sp. WG4 TaxID=3417649 RepID=UPI003CE7870E
MLLIAAGAWWGRLTTGAVRRAAVLGTTTSFGFALTVALIKGMTDTASHGIGALLTGWQFYGIILAGAGSMFLLQSAVHAGSLLAAQPGLSLGDPVLSILWGTLVFGEEVQGGLFIAVAALAAAAVGTSVLVLARSPLLADDTVTSDPSRSSHDGTQMMRSHEGQAHETSLLRVRSPGAQ